MDGRPAETKSDRPDNGSVDELWAKYARNPLPDTKAELFEHYQVFANKIAKGVYSQRSWTGLQYQDCLQCAAEGLLDAISRYDAAKGATFTTYASYRIKGAILNALDKYSEEYDYIAYQRRLARDRVTSLVDNRDEEKGKVLDDIANVTIELAIGYLFKSGMGVDSLAEQSPYMDPKRMVLQKQLAKLVEELPVKARKVVEWHYFDDLPFTEIAAKLSVSKARVSQLHSQAMRELRVRSVEK